MQYNGASPQSASRAGDEKRRSRRPGKIPEMFLTALGIVKITVKMTKIDEILLDILSIFYYYRKRRCY